MVLLEPREDGVPTYAPGSFTKNLGWNRYPPGLKRLHTAIRAGFQGVAEPVARANFRRFCGIPDPNRQLLPLNFFLHNTIIDGENYVTNDELVRHAINNPHSPTFDRLALFSLHLAKMGRRVGVAGDPHGAGFTHEFVRNRLWQDGGWRSELLNDREVELAFDATIQAEGEDTVHKCVTNYLFIMAIIGFRNPRTPTINTKIEEWVGPGLFVAFDRYSIDRDSTGVLNVSELISMVNGEELHKLMGTTRTYLEAITPVIADKYIELGAMHRVTGAAMRDSKGDPIVSSPSFSPWKDPPDSQTWSDEDAEEAAAVARRLQETNAQIRNTRNVRELKSLYQNTCMFCGKQTVTGVNPLRHYSEAAHVRPVGEPHNGPDRKDNMVILCAEHHLQFDKGLLRLREAQGSYRLSSKIPGDTLHNTALRLRSPHTLSIDSVKWHYNYWAR